MNGDAIEDIVVGDPDSQFVVALSGLDGSQLFTINGPTPYMHFGVAIAACDLSGDGIPEILVGASMGSPGNGYFPGPQPVPFNGSVLIYRGTNHQLMRTHLGAANQALGAAVEVVDDLDGDGIAEYAVGAPGAEFASAIGHAYVFSGATGVQLHDLTRNTFDDRFGGAIAQLPDMNDDGTDDIVVGACLTSTGGLSFNGIVSVYSSDGVNVALQNEVAGLTDGEKLGRVLASLRSDFDGDGHGDFIAQLRPGGLAGPNACGVFSGDSDDMFTLISGTSTSSAKVGHSLDSVADLDADGRRDVILSNPLQGGGYVILGSSANAQELFRVIDSTNVPLHKDWGWQSAVVGDLDDDGYEEWAVTSPVDGIVSDATVGTVWVYSLRPLYADSSTLSVSGSTPEIGLQLNGGEHRAGDSYLVLASVSGTSGFYVNGGATYVPLAPDGVTALSFLYANVRPFLNTFGMLDSDGQNVAQFDLAGIAGTSALVGASISFAYPVQGDQVEGGPQSLYFCSNPQTVEFVP